MIYQKLRDETELQLAEETLKLKELEIMAKQLERESRMRDDGSFSSRFQSSLERINFPMS
jgi:hypothetical protein